MPDEGNADESTVSRLQRRAFLGAAGAGLSVGVAGCSSQSASETETTNGDGTDQETSQRTTASEADIQEGGRLVWAHSEQVIGLDAHTTAGESSYRVLYNVHEPLIGLDEDLNLSTDADAKQPGLAKDFSISDDATTFTFELREGVTFHNGNTLDAEDVKYSFERIKNPDTGATNQFIFKMIDSVEIVDQQTVKTTLSRPFRRFPAQLVFLPSAIIPKGTGDQQGDQPIGAGPFTFEERDVGEKIVMEAFDDYWGTGPHIDVLEERTLSDPNTRLSSVTTGSAHLTNDVPMPKIQEVMGNTSDDLETKSWNPLCVGYVLHNMSQAPFDSHDWRQAVDYAIDKEQLVQGALYGNGQPTESGIFPNSKFHNDSLEPREQDLEKAKQLIADSEYDPSEFDLKFKVSPNYPWHVVAATIMQQWLTQAGMNVEVEKLQWAEWLKQTANLNYTIAFVNWFESWDPAYWLRNNFHSDGAYNTFAYSSDEFDSAMDAAASSSTEEEAVTNYKEAQRIVHEDLPGINVWFREGALAAKSQTKGLSTVPNADHSMFRFEELWLDE